MKPEKFSFYNFLARIEKESKATVIGLAFFLVLFLGVIDYLTGFEFSFSFFYLIPIAIITWRTGQEIGLIFSAFSATTWAISNYLAGDPFNSFVTLWNTLMRLGFFVVLTLLLNSLRKTLDDERTLSRTDPLTGALNRRAFYEILATRAIFGQNNPTACSLVYIDVDNFKRINDTFGHMTGDKVLIAIAKTIKHSIRHHDHLARLGGDEFSILLSETDQFQARFIIQRIQDRLLESMRNKEWDVTFSIGVQTFLHYPPNISQMISTADQLMYDVKLAGKNAIIYSIYDM